MTFEKVLKQFSDYLAEDKDCEVFKTLHGYTVLVWDNHLQNWETCECCVTPEKLAEELANAKDNYMAMRMGISWMCSYFILDKTIMPIYNYLR